MIVNIPIVPRDSLTHLALNMARISQAEHRVDEIVTCNEHKGPELMAFFNKAYIDATDYSNKLAAEIIRAQKLADKRKSVVILDEVPRILKEKGLVPEGSSRISGTVSQQEAILTQDPQYQEAVDLVDCLEHYKDLMDRKMDTIEKAYLGVRKILGGDRMQYVQRNVSSGAPGQEEVEVHSYVNTSIAKPTPYVLLQYERGVGPYPVSTPKPTGPRSSF